MHPKWLRRKLRLLPKLLQHLHMYRASAQHLWKLIPARSSW
jgi:hypothetical protein